ncbi:flagellin N-terminal helical domain-containing protein [Pelagibacterium xiamenense]|uniref:flagellin N-terminal helical domain-containing protein n=1 Tax=Pelagibacterium xiamenense TaxID=2901140 RepID=UPI001E65D649|nr:flagellin [Pelagibacterium xiamenense]MCD7060026.1 flagellar protein [Pelagibacterium xiamenense]
MSSDVSLSKAVRSNLLHLQNTAKMMDRTQERLATGLKVNSALDNPTNFFTAASLKGRAADIGTLLDAMSNGIRTIEAADNGLSAITKTIESMQSTLRQARQDKSFQTQSYTLGAGFAAADQISFSDGAVGATPVGVDLTTSQGVLTGAAYTDLDFDNGGVFGETLTFDIATNGGTASSVTVEAVDADTLRVSINGNTYDTDVADTNAVTGDELATALNTAFAGEDVGVTTDFAGGAMEFTADDATGSSDAAVTVSNVAASGAPVLTASFGFNAGGTASTANTTDRTVDQLVTAINANADLDDKVRASNDNGKLRIENQSTSALSVTGANDGTIDASASVSEIDGNDIRASLARQFNELRTELDRVADDASYNGVNLLRGDQLKIVFNESGTSTIEIEAKNAKGEARAINVSNLGILEVDPEDLDADEDIDTLLANLQVSLNEVRAQASDLGSTLSVVQNREDFTKEMINTLETGASNLTLADSNEEAANMLALQTRQQLSQTALSLASQADQAVLRLFG